MNPSTNTTIRPFRPSDLAALQQLIHDTTDTSYADVYPPRAVAFFKAFHSKEKILDRSRSGALLVMEENGELVATGSMVDGAIFAVFVNPRLQMGGRGKGLMHALEESVKVWDWLKRNLIYPCPPDGSTKALATLTWRKNPEISAMGKGWTSGRP